MSVTRKEIEMGSEAKKTETKIAPECVSCGKTAGWTVEWLIPQRAGDSRLVCSSRCAIKASDRK